MDTTVMTLIILIIIVLYALYIFIQAWSVLSTGLVDLSVMQKIPASSINTPTSSTFYYSAWFYINGTSSGSLFAREVSVDISGSTLKITANTVPTIITDQFPTSRWVFFVLNVISGQFMEVYLNGKLVKSVQFANNLPPISKDAGLSVGNVKDGSVSGYMTKLIRNPTSIDSATVWANYLQGNGKYSGMMFGILDYLDSLGLKIDLSRNGELQREISLGNVIASKK